MPLRLIKLFARTRPLVRAAAGKAIPAPAKGLPHKKRN
jgi:hypothetical protein